MNKAMLEKLRQDLPIEAITSKGKAKDYITGEEIELMGYKWQYLVKHLNDNFDWEFKIINTWSDEKNWYVHGRLSLNTQTLEQTEAFTAFRSVDQIGSAERKKASDGYAIKGAVDDCLSRCCAMFEIGMRAYLGLENRKPVNGNEKAKIEAYMQRNELNGQQFRDKLLDNGFEHGEALNQIGSDLNALENLSAENSHIIWEFITESRVKPILKPLVEAFDYELVGADFARVTALIERFKVDVVKEAINKFIGNSKTKPETIQKRQALMTGEPSAKWNYITTICNNIFEQKGKVNKEVKEEVGKIMGSGSASVNPSPY